MTLKRIITNDKNIQFIQDNIETALFPLQNNLMTGAKVIANVTLTSAQDNLVPHQLGRVPQIYFVGNIKVNTNIWSPNTASLNGVNSDSSQINLRCSTTCVVTLWIN